MQRIMKKAYQKPEVRVVSMEQEMYLMRGSTFENYAKQNDFVESENEKESSNALDHTLPTGGSLWNDEVEE